MFSILTRLPDNCFVYHEPVIRGRRPDFVVIMPDIGVLIIEVKGGQAGNIIEADPKAVLWKRPTGPKREQHPSEQAYGYRRRLMHDCGDSFHSEQLVNKSGPYEGNLSFPVGHCAVLSQISRAQLHDRLGPDNLRIFDPKICITRDVLDRWEGLDGDKLKEELKDRFTTYWNAFSGLSKAQIDALRALVHPSSKVSHDRYSNDIRTLDERQRQFAFEIGTGHRIITGVAGSGKTIILIARAKYLSETKDNILLLCYNRNLANYFNIELADYNRNIYAATFHQWATNKLCGWQDRKHETDGEYGERALIQLRNGSREAGKYDAVLIDEGQDFPRSWFECARLTVKDPDPKHGQLMIVGDGAQRFYRRDFSTWREARIEARGRSYQPKKFNLDRNYRNTRQILEIAHPFQSRGRSGNAIAQEDDAGLAPPPVDPNFAIRDGPLPELVLCRNRGEECEYIAARIDALLLGDQRDAMRAEDVAILYPYRPNGDGYSNLNRLFDRLKRHGAPNWLASEAKTESGQNLEISYCSDFAGKGVKVSPFQGFKGLQARLVFVMWADLVPSGWRDLGDEGERAELYVGLTRAEDHLIITHSRRSRFLEDIQGKLAALAVCE